MDLRQVGAVSSARQNQDGRFHATSGSLADCQSQKPWIRPLSSSAATGHKKEPQDAVKLSPEKKYEVEETLSGLLSGRMPPSMKAQHLLAEKKQLSSETISKKSDHSDDSTNPYLSEGSQKSLGARQSKSVVAQKQRDRVASNHSTRIARTQQRTPHAGHRPKHRSPPRTPSHRLTSSLSQQAVIRANSYDDSSGIPAQLNFTEKQQQVQQAGEFREQAMRFVMNPSMQQRPMPEYDEDYAPPVPSIRRNRDGDGGRQSRNSQPGRGSLSPPNIVRAYSQRGTTPEPVSSPSAGNKLTDSDSGPSVITRVLAIQQSPSARSKASSVVSSPSSRGYQPPLPLNAEPLASHLTLRSATDGISREKEAPSSSSRRGFFGRTTSPQKSFLAQATSPQSTATDVKRDRKSIFARSTTPISSAASYDGGRARQRATSAKRAEGSNHGEKGSLRRTWLSSIRGKSGGAKHDALVPVTDGAVSEIDLGSPGRSSAITRASTFDGGSSALTVAACNTAKDSATFKIVPYLNKSPSRRVASFEADSSQYRESDLEIRQPSAQELLDLRAELDEAKRTAAQLEVVNRNYRKTQKQMLRDLREAQVELEKFKEARMNGFLPSDAQHLSEELAKTLAELLGLREEHEALLSRTSKSQRYDEGDQQELVQQKETLLNLQKDLADAMATISQLEGELETSSSRLGVMEKSLKQAQFERDANAEKVRQFERGDTRRQAEMIVMQRLQKEKKQLIAGEAELKDKLQKAEARHKKQKEIFRTAMEIRETEIKIHKKERDILVSKLEEMEKERQAQYATFEEEMMRLQVHLEKAEQYQQLNAPPPDASVEQILQLTQDLDARNSEIERLERALDEQQQEADALVEMAVTDLNGQISSLREQLAAKDKELGVLREQEQKAKKELQDRILTLENKVDNHVNDLDTKDERIKKLESQIETLETEIELLLRSKKNLQDRASKLENEIKDHVNNLDAKDENIKQLDSQIESLEAELNQERMSKNELLGRVASSNEVKHRSHMDSVDTLTRPNVKTIRQMSPLARDGTDSSTEPTLVVATPVHLDNDENFQKDYRYQEMEESLCIAQTRIMELEQALSASQAGFEAAQKKDDRYQAMEESVHQRESRIKYLEDRLKVTQLELEEAQKKDTVDHDDGGSENETIRGLVVSLRESDERVATLKDQLDDAKARLAKAQSSTHTNNSSDGGKPASADRRSSTNSRSSVDSMDTPNSDEEFHGGEGDEAESEEASDDDGEGDDESEKGPNEDSGEGDEDCNGGNNDKESEVEKSLAVALSKIDMLSLEVRQLAAKNKELKIATADQQRHASVLLATKDRAIFELKRQVKVLQQEKTATEERYRSTESELRETKASYDLLEEELLRMTHKIAEVSRAHDDDSSEDQQERIEQLEGELASTSARLTEASTKIEMLETFIQEDSNHRRHVTFPIGTNGSSNPDDISSLKAALREKEQEIERLRFDAQTSEEQLKVSKGTIEGMEIERSRNKAKIAQLLLMLEKQGNESNDSELITKSVELVEIVAEKEELAGKLRMAEASIRKLEEQNEFSEGSVQLATKLAETEFRLDEMRQQLIEAEQVARDLEERNARFSNDQTPEAALPESVVTRMRFLEEQNAAYAKHLKALRLEIATKHEGSFFEDT